MKQSVLSTFFTLHSCTLSSLSPIEYVSNNEPLLLNCFPTLMSLQDCVFYKKGYSPLSPPPPSIFLEVIWQMFKTPENPTFKLSVNFKVADNPASKFHGILIFFSEKTPNNVLCNTIICTHCSGQSQTRTVSSVKPRDHRRLQTFALEGASGGKRQKYGAN